MAGHATAAGVHARRAAVDDRSPGLDIDHQPLSIHHIGSARQLDVADDRDQLVIEVVDAEIALRRFRRAVHDHTTGSIEPADLHASGLALPAGIGDSEPLRVERQLGLGRMDVAGEDCAVGAVLHLDPVGRDVHRRVAVVPLERRNRLYLAHLAVSRAAREAEGREAWCKDDAKRTHGFHLTPPCTIFKRAPPSSTTVLLPRSALSWPAWN